MDRWGIAPRTSRRALGQREGTSRSTRRIGFGVDSPVVVVVGVVVDTPRQSVCADVATGVAVEAFENEERAQEGGREGGRKVKGGNICRGTRTRGGGDGSLATRQGKRHEV